VKDQLLCTDGATTGQSCGARVNGYEHYADGHVLWTADATLYGLVLGGDSGGPVYLSSAGGVTAVGMISGRNGPDIACPPGALTSGDCSSHLIFADVYTDAYVNHSLDFNW